MNKIIHYKYLPYLIPGLGGIAMALQALLLRTADGRGLVSSGHILYILAWLLAVAAVSLTSACVLKLNGPNRYNANFPASIPGAVGSFLLAAGIAASLLFGSAGQDLLTLLWLIFGIAAILSLIFTGICRISGRRPAFFFHGVVFLFFAMDLVCQCRVWSSESQMERYSFALLASIGLMLTGYYRAAFDSGIGRRRMQLFIGLLTCFFCLAAVPGSDHPLLYLTGGAWAVTNLCVLTPPKRRPRPAPPVQEP